MTDAGAAALLRSVLDDAARRTEAALAAVERGSVSDARPVADDLHRVSGESAVLGCRPVAEAGWRAEQALRRWLGGETRNSEECRSALNTLAGAAHAAISGEPRAPGTPVGSRERSEADGASAEVPVALLLDDSDVNRLTMSALLEDAGFRVVEAATIAEARRLLGRGGFRLAVLDVRLPDGLGPQLIPEVRASSPGVKVAVLSGGDSIEAEEADEILTKADDPERLVGRLRALAAAEAVGAAR